MHSLCTACWQVWGQGGPRFWHQPDALPFLPKDQNGVPPCGVYATALNDLLCSVIYSVNAGVEGIASPLGAERAHLQH